MRKKDLNRSFSGIDEKYLAESEKRNTGRFSFVKMASLSLMCVLMIIVAVKPFSQTRNKSMDREPSGGNEYGTQEDMNVSFNGKANNPLTVFAAELPEVPEYPEFNGGNYEAYETDLAKWQNYYNPLRLRSRSSNTKLTDFNLKTMKEFLKDNGANVVYSPINVYFAMALLAESTGGNTSKQIMDVMGISDKDELAAIVNDIWNYNERHGAIKTRLGNSIWMNKDVSFKKDLLTRLMEKYHSSTFVGKMGELTPLLIKWINEQTFDFLKDQVDDVTLTDDVILALASSIYYKNSWAEGFIKGSKKEIFHAPDNDLEVIMMRHTDNMAYVEAETFRAVRKNLLEGDGMWIILPNEGKSFEDVMNDPVFAKLTADDSFVTNHPKVALTLPEFDVKSEMDLVGGFSRLGITEVFEDGRSDFSPLTDNTGVYVDAIKHIARVKADEDGVIAAAVTLTLVKSTSIHGEQPISFVADRPYMFIMKGADNTVLFSGIVNNPIE